MSSDLPWDNHGSAANTTGPGAESTPPTSQHGDGDSAGNPVHDGIDQGTAGDAAAAAAASSDDDGSDSDSGSDVGMLHQDSHARRRELRTRAFKEGMEEGKAETVQEGFDKAFCHAAVAGFEQGQLRGVLR